MSTKISVIIPAYNASQYIERALKSVWAQTRPADEIIVVNDGSQDNTSEIVRKYSDKVTLIEQSNNGVSSARNAGIKAAAGDWITFLDADDEWLPDKLQLQCNLLQQSPELSWIGGNYYRCDCLNNHSKAIELNAEKESEIRKKMENHGFFRDYFTAFLSHAGGHTDTMMVRKEMIVEAGLFCEQQPILEDEDLWLRLAYMDLPYGFVFGPLAVYHIGVQQSLTKISKDSLAIDAYMHRHLKLSMKANKLEEFQKCARWMLSHRIRLLFSCRKGKEVRFLIKKYGGVLAPSFRVSCYLGSFCPPLWNCKEKIKNRIRTRFRMKCVVK